MIVPVRTTCILPDFIATATIGCSSLSYMEQRESLVRITIGEMAAVVYRHGRTSSEFFGIAPIPAFSY